MSSDQEILAKIRTLLAIERNYLSEERTALAEFRTGLTIALVSLPAVSLVHYFFEAIPNTNPIFAVLLYLSFAVLTVIGIWISMKSRLKLKKTRQKIWLLKDRQLKVMKDSNELCSLLEDCIIH
jgi:uncharacterized membrane protein YidH (DUF202 family)